MDSTVVPLVAVIDIHIKDMKNYLRWRWHFTRSFINTIEMNETVIENTVIENIRNYYR